jgi:hypothetical protein
MANGIFPPHPYHTSQSSMANRQQGLMMPLPGVNAPAPGMPPQQGGQFSGPQGMQQMNQMYGLLAQHADDPTQVGMDYIRSAQQQQVLDRQNAPIEKFLQLYGNVNPYDWTAQSLQKFHDNYVKTGGLQFDLLQPKQKMSSVVEKSILDADTQVADASNAVLRFSNLSDRFMQAARTGEFRQGLPGAVDQWITRNITGEYDDINALKQDYIKLRNSQAIKDLPPGVASDRDVAIAMEGWPPPNASPAYMASFLRGLQKMQVASFARNSHKSNYLSLRESPKGLTGDWMKNRNSYIDGAWRAHGLDKAQLDAKYSNKEAAEILAQQRGMYMTPSAPASTPGQSPAGGPSPVVPARQGAYENMTVDELIKAANP